METNEDETPKLSQGEDLLPHEAEWLSMVRYQLLTAEQQAEEPPPLDSLALNMAQDAVESMVGLVAEKLRVELKNRPDFLQAFDAVTRDLGGPPPVRNFRPGLAALNQARVGFKHHGNQVESATIRRHVGNARDSIGALVERVFGLRLDEISLLLFVRDDEARGHLESAQKLWGRGASEDAMVSLRLAYDRVVKDYEQRKSWHPGKTLFTTKPSFLPSRIDQRKYGDVVTKTYDWLGSLDSWVRMLALGVNAREYAFFDAYSPRVFYLVNGGFQANALEGIILSESVFRRCYKFVVDTALTLGGSDYDFDAWAARKGT